MKRVAVLSLIFLIATGAMAQDINKKDAQGNRDGLWKGTYEASKRPRYEGTFNHGKETGTFKFFDDTQASTLMATRVFAKDGSCYTTFFEPTGTKVSEGKEVNHLQEGEWKYYHYKNKAVMAQEFYKAGKLNGARKVFFENGTLAEETNYVNGVKEGAYKKYTEKGLVLEEATYKNDEFNGPAAYRDADGNVASQGLYKNGLKHGVWKFYDKGKLVKETDMSVSARKAAGKAKTEAKKSN
ncbi:toxin-antitoxin system YwqK family antitoxin [Flavobacterium psychrotrophum]|uniref:toxin-antitoxin system YwqK family antitoxin n=1 Tax=Flavobacterium psychrotrophum TaxID=2294119 RepID=UPI000E30C074|nr:toxin-antitoxin system YwqK family antitoxin [Flavobacterium psychrotrophum]